MEIDPKSKKMVGLGNDYKLRICKSHVLHKYVDLDKSVPIFTNGMGNGTVSSCSMTEHSVIIVMGDLAIIVDIIINNYPDETCNEFIISSCKFLLDSFSVIVKLYDKGQIDNRQYYKRAISVKDVFDNDSKNTPNGYKIDYALKESIVNRYLEILEKRSEDAKDEIVSIG